MILLHRLTSFVIALVAAIGFATMIFATDATGLAFVALLALVPLLYGRLLNWDIQHTAFWVFLGTPFFFLISALLFFLFVEFFWLKIALGVIVTLGLWIYAENLFTFYHLPASYQAYSLEHLSLVLFVLGGFFFTSSAYELQLFLQLPVWVPALAVFWASLAATTGVFWASKVNAETSARFAFAGAVMLTEIYLALAMLPTSFIANSAAFTICLYLYLGLTRAHVLDKLTWPVARRYLVISSAMMILVFATARWA